MSAHPYCQTVGAHDAHAVRGPGVDNLQYCDGVRNQTVVTTTEHTCAGPSNGRTPAQRTDRCPRCQELLAAATHPAGCRCLVCELKSTGVIR